MTISKTGNMLPTALTLNIGMIHAAVHMKIIPGMIMAVEIPLLSVRAFKISLPVCSIPMSDETSCRRRLIPVHAMFHGSV